MKFKNLMIGDQFIKVSEIPTGEVYRMRKGDDHQKNKNAVIILVQQEVWTTVDGEEEVMKIKQW